MKPLLFFLFLLAPALAEAQPNTFCNLRITVKDNRLKPLGGASIMIRDTTSVKRFSVTANHSGVANIRLPKYRIYEIYSAREGYKNSKLHLVGTDAADKNLTLVNHPVMKMKLPEDAPAKRSEKFPAAPANTR